MNTIKIPVKVTTVEETFVEVELPCYTKDRTGNCFHHVFNPEGFGCTQVMHSKTIWQRVTEVAFETGYELITKAEYEEQFEKALSILKRETL
jgi:hypothetical protein